MIKLSLATIAVFASLNLAQCAFTDGPCGKAEVTFGGYYGRV